MNSKLSSLALVVIGALALTSRTEAAELTVTITDFRNTQGHLLLSIVDSEAGWNGQAKPVAAEKWVVAEKAADGKSLQAKFSLPAGKYAVQVLHDENDNGTIDFNSMGIPTEGHGTSNNPVVQRRPHFSEAVFELTDAPTTISIRLQ